MRAHLDAYTAAASIVLLAALILALLTVVNPIT